MKKSIKAIAISIFVISCAIAYWQWTKSPRYSLNQIVKSVENRDVTTFQKHVDVKSVASRLVDDLAGQIYSESDDELGDFASALGEGLLQLMKPRLVEMFEEQTLRFVERGSLWESGFDLESEDIQDLGIDNITDNVGINPDNFEGIDFVRKNGKTVYIGLNFVAPEFNEVLTLEVMMRDLGGYWQLAEISNMKDVLEEIDRLEAEKLSIANAPIREKIESSLQIEVKQKTTRESDWGMTRFVILTFEIENLSDRQIESFDGMVNVHRDSGEHVTYIHLSNDLVIQPNQQISRYMESRVTMFELSMSELYETDESALAFSVTINHITFEDGEVLQIYQNYSGLP